MAKHQIIYTSCMRGIDGVNDGQQIFSYDESFKDSKVDEVKSLFTYQVPALPAGVLMSEEIAKTMPVSFMYRLLKNGCSTVTLNTYLGRDYMGSAGRFGNHLSHSIICDFSDFDIYPCEMYASTALRSRMEYEEVNNPEIPAYLCTPELTRGYVIDSEAIIEFLGIGDNLEHYKKMVTSMLKFSSEKKRIIICDEPENVAKWIAALHYALPLDIAKKVNFTTYEFDPELSPSQICGVISEGSRYNVSNYMMSNRHYVFDFINNQYSRVENESVFIDFLDTAFSFSYDSLQDFHEFVLSKTIYRNCDEQYLAAYYLYNLLSESISEITKEQFEAIVLFAEEYLTNDVKQELLNKLVEEQYKINKLENDYALLVLGYMMKELSILDVLQQKAIKQMIVDRLIASLSTSGITEKEFMPLYDNIDEMARTVNLSIPAELMIQDNRDSLLNMLSQSVEAWKVFFVVRIISDYVKDMKLSTEELYPNRSIGAIYYGIVQMMYGSGRQRGYESVERILDSFKGESEYFVNMALNIEGFLRDINLGEQDIEHLWNYFGDSVFKMEEAEIDDINSCLEEYERYDEMYLLYSKRINALTSFVEVRDYFTEYWNKWFKHIGYGQAYAAKALEKYERIYEKKMDSIPEKDCFPYACEILDIAMQMELKGDFIEPLCQAICEFMPLDKLKSDDKKLINDIYKYQRDVLKKNIEGRLLLFVIAIMLNKVTSKSSINAVVDSIREVSVEEGAKLSGLDTAVIKDYFEWSFDSISKFHLLAEDYEAVFKLFQFSRSTQSIFTEYWAKVSFKKSKGDKDYADFAEFLTFMFANGNLDDQDMVGKYLCKLSKQKLEDLDEEMKIYFKRDRKATHAWENVRDIASSTNPLLNNLSNLFKRK